MVKAIQHRSPHLCVLALLAALTTLAQTPTPPGKLIDIGGRRLHIDCTGSGSPTVVVENGGGSFSVEWALVQQLVSTPPHATRICTYDRAGYAWSDHGPIDESPAQVADDLHLLLQKASVNTSIILVCHSLGCFFARAYQRRYPEQIAGMVIVDGSHDDSCTLVLSGERKPIALIPRDQIPQAFEEYRRQLPVLKAGAANDPPFDRLPPDLQIARHWAFEKMIAEIGWLPNTITLAESWREELSALREQRLGSPHPLGNLPLIVIERTRDTNPTWHTQQLQLSQLSSTGKLIQAEGSGHAIHIERPNLVADAIKQIVAQSHPHP
jgi:pimeloyl-ACP methyl ester carboxylesterase